MSFFSSQIQVAIRVRPFIYKENPNDPILYLNPDDDRKITIRKEGSFHESYYDQIFKMESTQKDIYHFIKPLFRDLKRGINSTVFTYGQTGSGKTYTMFGNDWTDPVQSINYRNDLAINAFSQGNGIIPRAINDIFVLAKNFIITCSYVQIYNEKIYDLLEDAQGIKGYPQPKFTTYVKDLSSINPISQKPLMIRENKENGVYIEGVNESSVDTFYDCIELLRQGEKMRKKRQTGKNEMSSRSHTILILSLVGVNPDKDGYIKVHFCDLAGSEKYDKDANYLKYHFNEMVNINKSLTTLGIVINSLVNKKSHIPYRDSKLTQLLQNSLGGNTKTFVIANISPAKESYEETVSTLKFADRVHSLFTKVEPNNMESYNTDLVSKLTQELNELKQLLNTRRKKGTLGSIEEEIIQLRHENDKLKKNNNTNDQIERLQMENAMLKNELKKLSSRNSTSHSHVNHKNDQNALAFTGNEIISNNTNNIGEWKLPRNKTIAKDIIATNNRLKALEEMELNSMLKMNKEIEKIKENRNFKLFSKKNDNLAYLNDLYK